MMTTPETTLQATYDAMLTEGVAVGLGLAMLVMWIAMRGLVI
jgi:hypothetical protein